MFKKSVSALAYCCVLGSIPLSAADSDQAVTASRAATSQPASGVIRDLYPGLAVSGLKYATVAELPSGVLLRAEGLTITEESLKKEMAQAPKEMEAELKKNAFFVVENLATDKLLYLAARSGAGETKDESDPEARRAAIVAYLEKAIGKIEVTDAEVAEFYKNNKELCGGATLEQMKEDLRNYVQGEKREAFIEKHIETLGQRTRIQVSASWTKGQAEQAKDNPVDRARSSGKPTLVDFGATGCRPCEMMAPILETLKKKYEGKANVVFVNVREDQILGARYAIRSIPVQVFYDKDGKETFRHVGFFAQAEMERKLAEMGVK